MNPMETIVVIGIDDFVRCPVCDHRVDFECTAIGRDGDGPIYAAKCQEHGEFKWQPQENEEDEDDEEETA
ncbi:MAG: hypothetical protein E5Y34_11095 [Mesorhizobium sp.]|uniref:hypothetical protein n=1 Tax=Mesorhizobium sp. TaxID=1871066 RepID=UPI00122AD65E|nr:hypothetical protein [Mesorhizobium sp.]TIN00994.1 MAG: hypothetical protein E5Y34_11095 [Mesorhizobium sp.]